MPIYVYEIIKSGETFEVLQKITDRPLTEHPETGEPVRRILSAPAAPRFRYDRAVKNMGKPGYEQGKKLTR